MLLDLRDYHIITVCSPKTNVLKTLTLNFNICISHTLQKSQYENIKKNAFNCFDLFSFFILQNVTYK